MHFRILLVIDSLNWMRNEERRLLRMKQDVENDVAPARILITFCCRSLPVVIFKGVERGQEDPSLSIITSATWSTRTIICVGCCCLFRTIVISKILLILKICNRTACCIRFEIRVFATRNVESNILQQLQCLLISSKRFRHFTCKNIVPPICLKFER